ncbi:MAG: MFS transporter, partial [Dehalococcoidales bacterium]|nr:MFS transporter [Dehalococcoidales bacterium]
RNQGWEIASADGTLSAFYAASTLAVVPLSLVSDRIGSRKAILLPAIILTMTSIGILPFAQGFAVWILVILAGVTMDSFMATSVTMLLETEGVKQASSGTALGIVFTIAQLGSVISPPLGNSLARFNPGLPFIFWASLSIVAVVTLIMVKVVKKHKT